MPVIAPSEKFLEIARKSALIETSRLDAYLEQLNTQSTVPEKASQLAALMVRDGLLTQFQAQQLLAGKSKGFLITGKYKLLELLGVGGMGKVFLCEHVLMRRLVALKILPLDQTKTAGAVERFYREARASAALDHPNIVHAYDVDRDGKLHFLVMEYVDGVSLHEIVKRHGPLDPVRAAHYVSQAASGLQHANEAGWVHRDIKPGNLLLDRLGTVKILDMGLARFFHDQDGLTNKYEQQSVLGTIDYLAPEQAINSHDVDIRADIYSLGATFYFLLTGQGPFAGSTAEKLVRHQMRDPDSICSLRPEVPRKLEAVVAKMMAKDPADRYQTPNELIEALTPWTSQEIPAPPPDEMPQRSAAVASLCTPSSASLCTPSSSGAVTTKSRITKKAFPVVRPTKPVDLPFHLRALAMAQAHPKHAAVAGGLVVLAFIGLLWGVLTRGKAEQGSPEMNQASAPRGGPGEIRMGNHSIRLDDMRQAGAEMAKQTGTTGQDQKVENEAAPVAGDGKLYVTRDPRQKAGKANAFDTLAEALRRAQPGNEVIVLDPAIEEQVELGANSSGRGVSVVSGLPDGQRVAWRPAKGGRADQPLLEINAVEDFKLRGFVLDGADQLDQLIAVTRSCPGLRLDNVELSHFKRRAVSLNGAAGDVNKPITFTKVRCVNDWATKRTGITFEVTSQARSAATNQHIHLADSRFEGLFDAVVLLAGPALEVEFVRNRVWTTKDSESPWVSDCVVYKKTATPFPVRLTFASNTLSRLANILHFETLPPNDPNTQVVLRNNLLIGSHAFVQVDGTAPDEARIKQLFPNYAGNVTRPGVMYCSKGLFTSQLTRINFPYLVLNQSDDRMFLRYTKDSPLYRSGANGEPAGVPPAE